MSEIRRIYVEKKDAFAVEAKGLLADLKNNLLMDGLEKVRILARYDVMGLTDEEFEQARKCGEQTGLDTLVVHTVNDDY